MQPEDYMEMALAEARQAELMDEVPIGAIVVYHGKVIGAGHNMREDFKMQPIMPNCWPLWKPASIWGAGDWRNVICT